MIRRESHVGIALPNKDPNSYNARKRFGVSNYSRSPNICLRFIRSLWSIQMIIILVLVFAVIGTAGTIWPINYAFAIRGVNDVAATARNQTLRRATESITTYMESGPQFLFLIASSFGDSEVLDHPFSERSIFGLLSKAFFSPSVTFAEIGFPNGDVLAIDRKDIVYVNGSSTQVIARRWNSTTLTVGEELYTVEEFNLFSRPWYDTAIRFNKTQWTPIYTSRVQPPEIVIAITQPWLSAITGEFFGVLALEIDINSISLFLQNLQVSKTTRVILLDQSGTIVASSLGFSYRIVNGTAEAINADNHPDRVIRQTVTAISQRNYISLNSTQSFTYGSGRKKRTVFIQPITDNFGLEWYVVQSTLDSELLRSVHESNRISAGICAACIVAAVILAIIIGCIISVPLRTVCKELDRVSFMDFSNQRLKLHTFKLRELDQLDLSLQRMKRGLSSFAKYVPLSVVKAIVRTKRSDELGVIPRDLTVLFADIKDFTTISEMIEPHELVNLMCQFFSKMSEIIVENNGVVDKFIGDCVMALFNAPDSLENHEYFAVNSAFRMTHELVELNVVWTSRNIPRIQIRVGINSCNCLVGNVGSVNKMNYTALGDGVNVASRCEALNKRYSTEILITNRTWEKVNDKFLCRWVAYVSLKGKSTPIHVYEVICPYELATEEQIRCCELHLEARKALEALDTPRLTQLCETILHMDPNNATAKELLDKIHTTGLSASTMALLLVEK